MAWRPQEDCLAVGGGGSRHPLWRKAPSARQRRGGRAVRPLCLCPARGRSASLLLRRPELFFLPAGPRRPPHSESEVAVSCDYSLSPSSTPGPEPEPQSPRSAQEKSFIHFPKTSDHLNVCFPSRQWQEQFSCSFCIPERLCKRACFEPEVWDVFL